MVGRVDAGISDNKDGSLSYVVLEIGRISNRLFLDLSDGLPRWKKGDRSSGAGSFNKCHFPLLLWRLVAGMLALFRFCPALATQTPTDCRQFAAGPPLPSGDRRGGKDATATLHRRGKMAEHLFEDIFMVTRIDPDGKKFDRVNRIEAKSEQLDMYMQLDVATDIYPMSTGDKFTMVLAPTLNLDGTPDTGYYTQAGRKTLADKYDYVMHGKLYKISEETKAGQPTKVEIYASFGGLLMLLKGDPSSAANLELDQRLFLLMRKV
uniref:Uncharacterized protein n=1 Tax=Avena sativa TaxID=4498 RepID=A0ACD5Z757_AVESA